MAQQREVQEQQQQQQTSGQENTKNQRRPIIDLFVGFCAIPMLIFCALKLEQYMNNTWEAASDTRWMVFALGFCMVIVSLIIISYVTHRLGVCLWTGPLEGTPSAPGSSTPYNDYIDIAPPTYETVMNFDTAPPTYDCVINIESSEIAGIHRYPSQKDWSNKSDLKTVPESLPPSYEEISIHI